MSDQPTRKMLFEEAFALLHRAQELLMAARVKHEKKVADQQYQKLA